jgi:excisionase family DNA binding protein
MTRKGLMEKLLLRPGEVAETLGYSISRVYQLLAKGELPGIIKLGRLVRVSAKALQEWVDQQAQGGQGDDGGA